MANYNPATGQWEEEDEENSLTGGAAAFGVGSSPAVDGSAMTGPPTLPGGWKESYSGFTPDRENRVATVNNGDFLGALREASYLPTSADKYTNRFSEYFNTASQKLGQGWKDVQMISDTDNYNWQNMTAGPVYLATAANGEKYVVEVPHSPGGAMLDWQTSAKDGWTSLGLGDLGGEGNEKLGYNAGASMIPFDQFTGFGSGSAISLDNINPKGSDFGDFLKMAVPLALAAFALPELGGLFSSTTAGAEALGGAELLGELGGYGFTSAELAGSLPELLGGGSLVEAGLGSIGGLGLEGASGLISDLGSLFTPSNINGLDFSTFGDFVNGLDASAFNSSPIGGLDPSAFTGSNFTPSLGDAATSTLVDNGASSLSNLAPEIMGPPQASAMDGLYLDDWGMGTNSMGEMTNARGMRSLQDIGANTLRDLGVARDTAANLSQGAGKMYNFMTQSPGKAGMFKAPSPLEMLYKGGKAFMDYRSNKDAMGMYEDQIDKMRAWDDPNRARGDFANKEWMNTWSNPRQGFDQWMSGLGREFQQKANASAAAGGKRGSYMNSGKGLTDLYSKWMAGQNDRAGAIHGGFSGGRNTEADIMRYMAPMMEMKRNKYAPFGQAIDSIMEGFKLSDLFGS